MQEITLELRSTPIDTNAVEEGDLLMPGSGAWSCVARLADPEQPGWPVGALVRLQWMGQTLLGAVDSLSVCEGKTTVFVVGGDGGLRKTVTPKHYQNASGALIAQEACTAAGERFTAARVPQPAQFSQFPRARAPLADVLDALARVLGASWGVQADGAVWLGRPPWAAAAAFDADELDEDSIYQTAEFAIRAFGPQPGQTYNGRRVGCARYTHHPDRGPRLRLWYVQDGGTLDGDPLRCGLQDLIRQTLPLTWLGKYPGTVRALRQGGTWDVQLDESKLPPIAGARPRVFAPGARIVPPIGARVELSFEQGDPRYPVVELFEPGTGGKPLIVEGDTVNAGTLTLTVVAPGVLSGTYVDGNGTVTPVTSGAPIPIRGRVVASQNRAYL